jgi:2-iminobutanoate/2-iminopropanoate deaminase
VADKEIVRTERAPAPFEGAPYNQAVNVGGFVFVAGQLGLAPDGSGMVGPGVAEQTEQALQNLSAILEEAGSSLDKLAKTTVFLQNLDDFAAMNEVYAAHVGERPPARSTVEVGRLPSGALVEIEAIAHV